MPAAESRARPGRCYRRLPPADVRLWARGKPDAGNFRHFPRTQSAGQRAERTRHRIIPIEPCSRAAPGRPQAAAFRSARVGFYRAGCGSRHVHLPRRALQTLRGKCRSRRIDHCQTTQWSYGHRETGVPARIYAFRDATRSAVEVENSLRRRGGCAEGARVWGESLSKRERVDLRWISTLTGGLDGPSPEGPWTGAMAVCCSTSSLAPGWFSL